MKNLILAGSLLTLVAPLASGAETASLEVGAKGSVVKVESATSYLETSRDGERHTVYATATFGNKCHVPSQDELITASKYTTGKIDLTLGALHSQHACPEVYAPVTVTIKLLDTTLPYFNERGGYTVNGVEATLRRGVHPNADLVVEKNGGLIRVEKVEKRFIRQDRPGGYDYQKYGVHAFATFGNPCYVPAEKELVALTKRSQKAAGFQLVQVHTGKICPQYYAPVQADIKVGTIYERSGSSRPVDVNGVTAE